MNMTTPFTLPSCTPPRAYTPSPCSCQRCKKDNQCPKLFSSDNNMDPGSVPAELQGLSQTEEMLIARCCPIMRVIHLKGGQLGYGGHVVNVAQDITTFAATLPRLAADVPIIIIRREGQEPGQHKDLHVRRVRVQRALIWLIANNPYYRDIVLDDTALSQLPVHTNVQPVGAHV